MFKNALPVTKFIEERSYHYGIICTQARISRNEKHRYWHAEKRAATRRSIFLDLVSTPDIVVRNQVQSKGTAHINRDHRERGSRHHVQLKIVTEVTDFGKGCQKTCLPGTTRYKGKKDPYPERFAVDKIAGRVLKLGLNKDGIELLVTTL